MHENNRFHQKLHVSENFTKQLLSIVFVGSNETFFHNMKEVIIKYKTVFILQNVEDIPKINVAK
jgi:hypothetical protein